MRREGRPIIIRRVVEAGHAGHHGGAWKVAYADFVTAMMAFFLLLWLISSASEDTLKGLADFFSNATVNAGPPGGLGGVLNGMTIMPGNLPDQMVPPVQPALPVTPGQPVATDDAPPGLSEAPFDALSDELAARATDDAARDGAGSSDGVDVVPEARRFDRARAAVLGAIQASPELRPFKSNIRIDETKEGLRIQLLDGDQAAMFPVSSDSMYPHTRHLLEVVTRAVADLDNKISIRGHTDSLPYAQGANYDNWRLSADRANATRQVMVAGGLKPSRVAEIVGRADADPVPGTDPAAPSNRRISIILLHH